MIRTIAIAVVALIVIFLVYASTRPDTFRIERSTSIQAPPQKIFPLINDFHSWGSWSPWEKIDPDMKRTFSGAPSGPGSVYEWAGDANIGQGRMEIATATPASKVLIDMHFIAPFEAHNTAEFTLEPQGDSTKVTWAMYGPNTFVGKVIGIFMSMDKMIGDNFEAGLAAMKAIAEA